MKTIQKEAVASRFRTLLLSIFMALAIVSSISVERGKLPSDNQFFPSLSIGGQTTPRTGDPLGKILLCIGGDNQQKPKSGDPLGEPVTEIGGNQSAPQVPDQYPTYRLNPGAGTVAFYPQQFTTSKFLDI